MRRPASGALLLLFVCTVVGGGCGSHEGATTQTTVAGEVVGLYPLSVHDKRGYIDRVGDWVIQPQFDYAGPFSEGLATVAVSESHDVNNRAQVICSVIDPTGKVVITLQPGQFPHGFSGGVVKMDVYADGTTGSVTAYIDTTGKVIW